METSKSLTQNILPESKEVESVPVKSAEEMLESKINHLEWTEVDIDSENYPADFEECLLKDMHGNKHIGYMIKYGDDISNSEWELCGSDKDVEFEFVTHFISLKNL